MSRLRSLAKRALPQGVVDARRYLLFELPRIPERRNTRRIFEATTGGPSYLDAGALEALQATYRPRPEYRYDADALEMRGLERSARILRLPGARAARSFLELGCWDGMVSCCLHRKGKEATAIDSRDSGFDARASGEGVRLLRMDAADLRFEDGSFDFVFSFDTFEHVASPERVLLEAIRVLREGGHLYLDFGPLYFAPYGEHAYRSITVPYCQFLFEKDVISDFTSRRGLPPIDFGHVNGWSLQCYRELWDKYSGMIERVRYREVPDLSHLGLIRRYPSCFKSKSSFFDNFVVSSIEVLFEKKGDAGKSYP